MPEPYTLVLEFSRTREAGDPFAMRMEPQAYNRRLADKTYKDAELAWDEPFVAAIEALRAPRRDPEIVQRLGNALRAFLEKTGWAREEAALSLAVDEKRPVVLTIRSAAAELYALPWELLALGQTMRHVGELPNVTVRYEWPGTKTKAEEPSPRPEGGRIFLAYSHAGGKVLANEHMGAIQDACDEAGHDFDMERDVLAQASHRSLGEALAEARKQNKPIAVLELLAHGGPIGSTFGLMLDPDDAGGPPGVDADRLASLLGEHADMIRLVVLIACDSGNTGRLGNHMGSVAQALHRAGVAAVVASRYPFSVKGAGEFVRAFYRELLVPPRSVEDAFVTARQRLAEVATRLDWASVQLYAREDDGMDSRPLVVRPYQGLLPLGPAQSRFFFGREREAQEIVSDLGALVKADKPRFLFVQGWSGTGKSSMVMAGAVPRLTRAADPAAGAPGEPGWSPGYADASLIADAEERLAHDDPGSAMQLLDAVHDPYAQRHWLGLALSTLKNTPTAALHGHEGAVSKAAFSPDSAWIVTGSLDHTARVWNVRDPNIVYKMVGHAGAITSVAFSLDSAWIATGSDDQTARVWSARDPSRSRQLVIDAGTVRRVRFGKNDTVLTVSVDGPDGKAQLWSDATPSRGRGAAAPPIAREIGHHVVWAAFSRDLEQIVTASGDGTARVWDARDLEELAAIPRQGYALKGAEVVWDDETRCVMTVGEDGRAVVWVWEGGARKPWIRFPLPGEGVSATSWSLKQDCRSAVVGYSDGAVRSIVRTATGDHVVSLKANVADQYMVALNDSAHDGPVMYAIYQPVRHGDEGRFLTASLDGVVRLWVPQIDTGEIAEEAALRHPGAVLDAAFDKDGKSIVTGCYDKIARTWRVDEAQQGLSEVTFNQDRSRMLIVITDAALQKNFAGNAHFSNARIYGLIAATKEGREEPDLEHMALLSDHESSPDEPWRGFSGAALSRDGHEIAGVTPDGKVRIWTVDALVGGSLSPTLVLPKQERAEEPFRPVLGTDGAHVLVVSNDDELLLYPTSAPAPPVIFQGHKGKIARAAPSADGRWVAAGTTSGVVYVWSVDAPDKPERVLRKVTDPEASFRSVGLSADGKQILALSDGGLARVWSNDAALPNDGDCLTDARAGSGACVELSSAEISPNGESVAAISGDHRARLWSVERRDSPETLDAGGINFVTWRPDSTEVLTGSADGVVRLWRATDGELLVELEGHAKGVVSGGFAPDGKVAVTTSDSGELRLWQLDVDATRKHLHASTVECLPEEKLKGYFADLEDPAYNAAAFHRQCIENRANRAAPAVPSAAPSAAPATNVPAVATSPVAPKLVPVKAQPTPSSPPPPG